MWLYIIAIFIAIATFIYTSFKKSFEYWKELDVPHIPGEFPFGSKGILDGEVNFGVVTKQFFNNLTRDEVNELDYYGLYLLKTPVLFVLTPEFAKTILVRDFQYFQGRGGYFNERDDPLSANLFLIEGEKWRTIRQKVTPTFTSGKMKMMFHAVVDVANQLNNTILNSIAEDNVIDMKELMARFTTDVIGTCAFGIECNSLMQPDAEFRKYGKKIFEFTPLERFKLLFTTVFMKQANALGIMFNKKDVADFFLKAVRETIEYREKNNVQRDDFMQLMINLKNKGVVDLTDDHQEGNKLTFEEVAAQAYLFFIAGFETSSTTITCALFQLALRKDIQDIARKEVKDTVQKFDNRITYEGLSEMHYLENVLNETLRMYPPVPTLLRKCTKPYQLPNKSIIKEGTLVFVPNYGFQMSEKYFPEPLTFDPNRFNSDIKNSR